MRKLQTAIDQEPLLHMKEVLGKVDIDGRSPREQWPAYDADGGCCPYIINKSTD